MNRARTAGYRSSTPTATELAEFYGIYRETAGRAGFLIRTEAAYRDVWEAFRPARPRPAAVRPGRRTATPSRDALPRPLRTAGRRAVRRDDRGRRRAPGQLPPEVGGDPARSRERGATTLRPVGPRDPGIAQFKAGFGGREVRYIGAWDLVLDPLGRRSTSAAQAARVRIARRRRGLTAGSASAYAGTPAATRRTETTRVTVAGEADRASASSRRLGRAGRSTARAATSTSRGRGRAHRAAIGWRPRYLVVRRRLRASSRCSGRGRSIGGCSAYVPRGPISAGDAPSATAARLVAVAALARRPGRGRRRRRRARCPPRPATPALLARGRLPPDRGDPAVAPPDALPLAGADEEPAFERDREVDPAADPRSAESSGVVVVRHDARLGRGGPGRGLQPRHGSRRRSRSTASTTCCSRPASGAASRSGRARRSSAGGRPPSGPATSSYLEAQAPGGYPLAGLLLYRHGRRLTTVHCGDHEAARRDHPGALHLLRWRAIQLAIAEGRDEMDLGGVDVAGARREPRRGRADVRPVPAQASRSGRSGSSSPAPTSGSSAPTATGPAG